MTLTDRVGNSRTVWQKYGPHLHRLIVRELDRFPVRQCLHVNVALTGERFPTSNEGDHATVGRQRWRRRRIGEVRELLVLKGTLRDRLGPPERDSHRHGCDNQRARDPCERAPVPGRNCNRLVRCLPQHTPEIDNELAHRLIAIGCLLLQRFLHDHA